MGVIIVNGIEYSGAGGGSGDVRYIKQAEYDALPDSKYTDNIEYRITDAGINGVSASNVKYDNSATGLDATTTQQAIDKLNESLMVYSTQEKVVGTWIDGRPIYEKTYYLPTIESYEDRQILITLDQRTDIDINAFLSFTGGQNYNNTDWFHIGYETGVLQMVRIVARPNEGILLVVGGYKNGMLKNGNYVVRYMKTTD